MRGYEAGHASGYRAAVQDAEEHIDLILAELVREYANDDDDLMTIRERKVGAREALDKVHTRLVKD